MRIKRFQATIETLREVHAASSESVPARNDTRSCVLNGRLVKSVRARRKRGARSLRDPVRANRTMPQFAAATWHHDTDEVT
jgi:hypothetical protein